MVEIYDKYKNTILEIQYVLEKVNRYGTIKAVYIERRIYKEEI